MKRSLIIVIFGLLLLNQVLHGQEKQIILSRSYENLTWMEFVNKLESNFPLHFYFDPDETKNITIDMLTDSMSLQRVLEFNLNPLNINYSIDKQGNVFISRGFTIHTALPPDFFEEVAPEEEEETVAEKPGEEYLKTGSDYIIEKVVIGNEAAGAGKRYFTLSGMVSSSENWEPIVGGTIYVDELETGTTTDANGFYTIRLKKGRYTLTYNSIDSEEKKYRIEGHSDGTLNIVLQKKMYELDEVEIRSRQDDNVRGIQMGYVKLDARDIKEVPVVLGERDIIKVALLLPGVQTVGEGSSGFNVRGSPADQNMFYISSVPVYNSAHFFGFFSAFNPDIVDEFTLYKSNIPAVYGGRLSSIFDITARQGNLKKFSARGGISPITARLMVEGPVIKDKLSVLAGFRATYSDWVLRLMKNPDLKNSRASFGDAVMNISYNINQKNRLSLFGYYSRDRANLVNQTTFEYENIGASVAWLHSFSRAAEFNLSFDYCNYGFREQNSELSVSAYDLEYRLNHNELDFKFTLRPHEQHTINTGVTGILYHVDRGTFNPLNEGSLIIPKDLGEEKGIEGSIYLSDEWKIMPALTLYGGLRYNYYAYLGPADVFQYSAGSSRTPENIIDTISYAPNSIVNSYGGLDFRFAATYLFNPNLSVKASYNRLHQYIFMLSNTIALAPTDKWKLADYHIEPMVGDQVSLGFYTNLAKHMFEFSVEGYYKWVDNLVEYRDGADLIVNEFPEQEVLQGKLNSYGVEFMIKKPYGRLNGWVNYTYSRSIVEVQDSKTGDYNNFGTAYPANWDKPHAFNLVANYKLSRRLSLSADVVYSTGRPITYPTAIYYQDGQEILHYSLRNEYRLPDYFRVDASVILEGNLKKKKFLHGSWIFSIYNLTGRRNAYSVYFKSENGRINGYKLSIFGTQIFSITYDFKLGNIND